MAKRPYIHLWIRLQITQANGNQFDVLCTRYDYEAATRKLLVWDEQSSDYYNDVTAFQGEIVS